MIETDIARDTDASASTIKVGNGILERKAQRALRKAQELLCSSSEIKADVLSDLNCGKLTQLIRYANSRTARDADTESTTDFASLKLGR